MLSCDPLYVSYYTAWNGYQAEADMLATTLRAHQLPHRIVGVSSATNWDWDRATKYKAEFLEAMQGQYPGRPLVWLDADARVMQRPRMFARLDCDVACHWFRHRELLSGTLYLGPTAAAARLVRRWIKRNDTGPKRPCAEQQNLRDAIAGDPSLRVVNLPPEYTWIDSGTGTDLSARAYGRRFPVIVHRQASRRLRHVTPPPSLDAR